ncbi:MAG: sigma-54-dependent Fis family transcriptional regulator [Rhodospirillales bacterium]|nr:MAG: sigma-54-dependent Fis family transcriptional regulator [Rhodospirillales bacterium]
MRQRILVIEDDKVLNRLLLDQLERFGYDVAGRHRWSEAEKVIEESEPDLLILDCRLPDADGIELLVRLQGQFPVVMLTAFASVESAVRAIKNGAAEYLVKPVNIDELELVVKRALENAAIKREHQFFKSRLAPSTPMVGHSPALAEVNRLIDAVAKSDMTVLIQGESGVGKELVANAIHERSGRASRNFVAVDCCTLQKHLFESELFGHEKGSFTSADRMKKGLIEGAFEGTLFLDEIGEIEQAVQAKLLRVLETGRYRRVGGTRDHVANVRIVAATNRDLAQMAAGGQFRADLFYRLNAFAVTVPTLRERAGDIQALASHFIRNHDFSRRVEKTLTPRALARLEAYSWPGNIRELKNVVERAIILSGTSPIIDECHLALPSTLAAGVPFPVQVTGSGFALSIGAEPSLEEIKRAYLVELLARHEGHRARVARALGISERNTYRLIRKFGLGE